MRESKGKIHSSASALFLMPLIAVAAFLVPIVPVYAQSGECPPSARLGQVIRCSIDIPPELDTYTFDGRAGDRMLFEVARTSGELDPVVEIYRPDGTSVCGPSNRSSIPGRCDLDATGVHTLLVGDSSGNRTGSYELTVRLADPAIDDISTNVGGNSGTVTLQIDGTGFEPDATVKLVRAGQPDLIGQANIEKGRKITVIFDLTGRPTGAWDVVVAQPKSVLTVPGGFTIEEGGSADLWIDIVGRDIVRVGRKTEFRIRYGNRGKIDAWGPILFVAIPKSIDSELSPPSASILGISPGEYSELIDAGEKYWYARLLFKVAAGDTDEHILSITVPKTSDVDLRAWITQPLFGPDLSLSHSGNTAPLTLEATTMADANNLIDVFLEPYGATSRQQIRDELSKVLDRVKGEIKTSMPMCFLIAGVASLVTSGLTLPVALSLCAAGAFVAGAISGADEAQRLLRARQSASPEDKFGPIGYDPGRVEPGYHRRFIAGVRSFDYRIEYWNKEDAPVPTQDVIIRDQLDSDLDLASFEFGEIGFLKWKISVPPGRQQVNADVDLRPDFSLIVRVRGVIDLDTGMIEWTFNSMDPFTGQPPEDPFAGFLPPISDSGFEVGWVEYSVSPKQELPTGTEIKNQAFVKFDVGEFKPAPPNPDSERPGFGPWINTIDSGAPSSRVTDLPTTVETTNFIVKWEGEDDKDGSGIRHYFVYVSEDGGPFTEWLRNATDTSATFTGQPGKAYGFYSVARDQTGNVEDSPAVSDATTLVMVGAIAAAIPTGQQDSSSDLSIWFIVAGGLVAVLVASGAAAAWQWNKRHS